MVEGVVDAIWFNQGQVCCAGSRLLVQESVAEQACIRKSNVIGCRSLVLGDSLDKGIDVGALIDQTQLERVSSLVELGVEEGAVKWQPSCDASHGRLLLSADAPHRCAAIGNPGAGRDFRAGADFNDLQNTGRGGYVWPTTAATDWPQACGPKISTWRWMWRPNSRPVRSGSIAPICSMLPPASEATASQALAGKVEKKVCTSTSSHSGNPGSARTRCK